MDNPNVPRAAPGLNQQGWQPHIRDPFLLRKKKKKEWRLRSFSDLAHV